MNDVDEMIVRIDRAICDNAPDEVVIDPAQLNRKAITALAEMLVDTGWPPERLGSVPVAQHTMALEALYELACRLV